MKAALFTHYGDPDNLRIEEVEMPEPGPGQVRIHMRAASINDWDWALLHGKPFANRLMFGLRKPKIHILGSDVAGIVDAVGSGVTQFKPGDAVYGDLSGTGIHGWGGFAEYHIARPEALLHKPDCLSFEQAAALPQAAVLAWQGLLKGQVGPGSRVLINGASGGTGSFAIQMAKALGADVSGTARTSKLDYLRRQGCDHVYDFTCENFTQNEEKFDLILDLMAHYSIFDYNRALKPQGRYLMIGGVSSRIIQIMLLCIPFSVITRKSFGILAHKANKGLTDIESLIEQGKVEPVIDRIFPLEETANALTYFGNGHKKGKVVIRID